jgi:spore germination cell wall hydrolase CwlJ-like protein|tara:strand:+ start:965 stop:1501 length:537 start_codon:yes stop_codon:yes gene_type:complete
MMALVEIILAAVISTADIQAQQITDRAPECLALNMYHEARGQGTAGLFAVSAVVLNRVNDTRFPNSVCEVVEQGPVRESWKTRKNESLPQSKRKYYPIKNRCQFSWFCDGKSDTPRNKKKYEELLDLAKLIMYNELILVDITDGALFYHADYVTPGWAKTKQKTVEIQDHIFYRWDKK